MYIYIISIIVSTMSLKVCISGSHCVGVYVVKKILIIETHTTSTPLLSVQSIPAGTI